MSENSDIEPVGTECGYDVSRNYEELWLRIQRGDKLFGFVNYRPLVGGEVRRDPAQAHMVQGLGIVGHGFVNTPRRAGFLAACADCDFAWIVPSLSRSGRKTKEGDE